LPAVDHVGVRRFWNRYRGLEKDVKKILLKQGILEVDDPVIVFNVPKCLAWSLNRSGFQFLKGFCKTNKRLKKADIFCIV
jgi:hypothetical protein